MAAQLDETEAVAITGIASPSCIPRASAKNAPMPPITASTVHGLTIAPAPAIAIPSVSALIATLETPISRPEASPSTTPWQIEPRRRMPEANSAQPAPTITVSNAARVAIE